MAPKFLRSKIVMFLIIFLIFVGVMVTYSLINRPSTPETPATRVLLETSMGNITIELYNDMPITTGNFVNLTEHGVYDNTIFHRVVSGFAIQGGDPTGTGQGDPSIPAIRDELPNKHSNVIGAMAMANKGPNTGSSQFFINLVDNSADLDSDYPVFGKVVAGMEVVAAIGTVHVDSNDRPLEPVRLIKAIVLSND
jgi:peptidylprolyl isomerase